MAVHRMRRMAGIEAPTVASQGKDAAKRHWRKHTPAIAPARINRREEKAKKAAAARHRARGAG